VVEAAGLTDALIGFARTLTGGYDVTDVLHELAGRVARVVGVSGAGVVLRHGTGIRFVIADSEAVRVLEQLQEEHQQGPCVDAIDSGEPVTVEHLPDMGWRWPEYVARATDLGFAAVASLPMCNRSRIGGLDLYHPHRHAWSEDELRVARVFTDIATGYVLNASELQRQRRTAEQLQRALDSRVVIEQAKGIIAAERKVKVDQAFALLRKYANDHNATLRSVADAVVNLGLRI
jgi:GAF domain-containing protein